MKTAVILFSLAALGLAMPRPDLGLSVKARQETCLYDVLCRTPPPGEDVDPDTPRCCAVVGGTLHETGTQCLDLTHAQGTAYATCCAGSYAYARSHKDCPDIDVRA